MSEETKVTEVVNNEVSAEEVVATVEGEPVLHDMTGPIITLKKCLEAGVHFGHHTRKWNPKMRQFIYGARNGIYIIDLNKSVEKITEAYVALRQIVQDNGKVLFVGTKKQVQEIVTEEALRSGSFYITNRWLGGTLTNFKTIKSRIHHLIELEKMEIDGSFDRLPKKEVAILRKEKEKLSKNLDGIKEMRRLPNAIVITDPTLEGIAVLEARKLNIPVFGIVDTNTDPDLINFPIPANDDAVKSVRLVVSVLADAIVEAKGGETSVAYTVDEGEEATMSDAIRLADKENAQKLAAIRAARKEKQERYERMQAERMARRERRNKENTKPEQKTTTNEVK